MKKKLSLLLIGSLVAISLAGCSGSTSDPETTAVPSDSSVESAANGESTVSSDNSGKSEGDTNSTANSVSENSETKTSDASEKEDSVQPSESTASDEEDIGPKEGDIVIDEDGNEYVYHEDSVEDEQNENNDDSEDMPVTSDNKEEMPKYLDVTFTPIDIKDANIDKSSINMSSPVYYQISSVDEMEKFVSEYGKTYSVNDVESGVTFDTLAEKFDSTYFDAMSLVIIPAKYDKDSEPDIDTITLEGNDYVITVVTPSASSDDNTDCICFVVQVNDLEREDRNIVINVIQDSMIADGEEVADEDI